MICHLNGTTALIPLIFGDCITDADKCFDKFKTDLENQMKVQLDTAESQLAQICQWDLKYINLIKLIFLIKLKKLSSTDGSFNQFVNCIKEVESECHSDKRFRPNLCDKRYFKTRITRFTWKASFFYQLCHNTTPELSQG